MIVMDLDGVFADFASAAASIHGHWGYKITKWNFFEEWGMNIDKFWEVIHAAGDDFYREMVLPYPWAKELLEAVAATDDFIIMSSPSDDPCGYSAKKIWVDKYLQPHVVDKIKLIVGSEKWLLAGPDRLLIDDCEENLEAFKQESGYAVAFPQLWNTQRQHSFAGNGDCIKFIKSHLTQWKEKQIYEKVRQDKQRRKHARSLWPKGDSPGY